MDPKNSPKMPKDVHDLLLSSDEEEGKARDEEAVQGWLRKGVPHV